MTESKPTSEGLCEHEITGVLDLLGGSFEDGGKISEVSFPDPDGTPVKIMCENSTGFEDKIGVESSTILDVRNEIKDSI